MGFNDKNNSADGKDPDFGAIFMSNSATKRECFRRRLFGLPSTETKFVEQVKAGMVLFLFEYEKRQLHGVFKAICDGGINIVPNAFASLRKQFPAQIKFIPIWFCKPLPENLFRDAIRENYFSTNKFNFGLSENQVYKLLYLFSKRKLEPEAPGRPLTRTEDLIPKQYTLGKVGSSVDHGRHIGRVSNEQGVGGNLSPVAMHKCLGDSSLYDGEVEYIGLNTSDFLVNEKGRDAQLGVDTTSGHVSNYLALKDESSFTLHENEDYMDICLRPNIIGGYSKGPSDKIRVQGDGRLSISDRFMSEDLRKTDQRMLFSDDIISDRFISEDLRKTDQRMVFSDDIPGLHNSDVNPSAFYSKPNLEHNSLVQNQLGQTSLVHSIQAQILNNSYATQGDTSSKSTNLLYDPDVPGLNFSQSSSVGINNGANSIMESISLSNNSGRNSFSSQPCLIHPELKDMDRVNNIGGSHNSVLYRSNRDCMPLNAAQNSDRLASESVVYETCSIPSLKSSSGPIPPSDIGNSGRVHNPLSSLFHNYQSCLDNNVCFPAYRENLTHEIALRKNNETFIPDVQWENEGHSPDFDPLIHKYDVACHVDSQNNNFGVPKKKSSVFSRLSFMQDFNKQKNGNDAWNEDYDFHTSVDEVMERVRQSHNQWMKKRKRKPKHNKAEGSRDKTQIIGSRMKSDCFENPLTDQGMDLTTASGGSTDKTAEEACFVDFKRRSKVKKLIDENENRSSNESEKSESSLLVQQKKKKLIRPNFSKSTTSDNQGIDLGASQTLQVPLSHGSFNVKDVSESCALVWTEVKADAEVQNITDKTHSEDKNSSHARGYACSEGGERAADGAITAFNDRSECLGSAKADVELQDIISQTHSEDKKISHDGGYVCIEGEKTIDGALTAFTGESKCLVNIKNHNVFSCVSCKDKSCHTEKASCKDLSSQTEKASCKDLSCQTEKASCTMDSIKSLFLDTESSHSIRQEHHHVDNRIMCVGRGINTDEERPKDCSSSSFSFKVKDGSECLQNSDNEKAPIETSGPIKEGLRVMDRKKSVSIGNDSLHSICLEHHTCKIICTGRGSNTEEETSKDGGSLVAEVKDGLDCLQNSNNGNASIATCFKEGLCTTDCTKSVSPDGESLHSICQECPVDKVMGADRVIKNEEGMLKDGSSSFATGVKDGSDSSRKPGSGNAPIASCEQNMA